MGNSKLRFLMFVLFFLTTHQFAIFVVGRSPLNQTSDADVDGEVLDVWRETHQSLIPAEKHVAVRDRGKGNLLALRLNWWKIMSKSMLRQDPMPYRQEYMGDITNKSLMPSLKTSLKERQKREISPTVELPVLPGGQERCVESEQWQAKVVYVGHPLKILCDNCNPVDDVSWTKQSNTKAESTVVFDSPNDDDKRLILGGNNAIYIYHAELQDQGLYRCKGQTELISTYKVEVKSPGPLHVIQTHRDGENVGPNVYGNKIVNGRLSMYTYWSDWGRCSDCGANRRRERFKIGYCYAMSHVDRYPLGLPCSSSAIPANERSRYQGRMDEKIIEPCSGSCPHPKVNLIEQNLTIWDTLLGKGGIQEQKVEGYMGSDILLQCPDTEIDSVVTWRNGTRLIDAKYLAAKGDRVIIDIYNGLHIFELTRRDGQPYHCYVDGKRRETFRLIVHAKKLVQASEIYESFVYIGILIVLYTMAFAIIMLLKHNIRRRQRARKI